MPLDQEGRKKDENGDLPLGHTRTRTEPSTRLNIHVHRRFANLPLVAGVGRTFSFPLASTSSLSLFQNCHHFRFFFFLPAPTPPFSPMIGGGGLIGAGARALNGRSTLMTGFAPSARFLLIR